MYALIQDAGGWKIEADDHPSVPTAGSAAAPPRQQPQPPAISETPGKGISHNWAGYAATGRRYTTVSGSWTIPQVPIQGSFGTDAAWVGIGGVHSRDLIQAGTESIVSGSGQALFRAWIETLPQIAHTVPLAVRPGDSVTVSLTQQATSNWPVAFTNDTHRPVLPAV